MSRTNVGAAVRRLCGSLAADRAADVADHELLQRFLASRDEAAFAALVRRHGGLVLGVCRRVLHQPQDAEDVFQAAFLLLARKAASIRRHDVLGCWLYRVAYRMALKARAQLDRRRRGEALAPAPPVADPLADVTWREAQSLVDEELARLPEKYRAPLLLCYFEDRTQDEAARQLGWCKRTLKARLSRGRELLRARLTRRGLPLGSALLAAILPRSESAAAPLVEAVSRAAAQGAAAPAPAALVRGALREMALARCRAALVTAALTCCLIAGGVGLLSGGPEGARPPVPPVGPVPAAAPPRDGHGDPLPALAALRLGTERWRHGGTVGALVWSPDGKWLATGGGFSDWAVRFWDPDTGKELRRFDEHRGNLVALAVSRDGKLMASADRQGRLLLWNPGPGKMLQLLCHPEVRSLAFAPDGKTLAAVDRGGSPVLYDVASGEAVRNFGPPVEKNDPDRALALSGDGKLLAAAAAGTRAVRVWDAATGKLLHTLDHNAAVDCLAFSPDGKQLACGGRGETVRLWDVAGAKTVQFFKGHKGTIRSLCWSPDGKTVASGGADGTVRLWDVAGRRERLCFTGHRAPVSCVAFSPDGKRVASAGNDRENSVRVWDAATGAEPGGPQGHRGWVGWQALLPDGRTLLTAGADRTARLWDVRSGKPLGVLSTGQVRAKAFALSPDGKLAAGGGPDGTVRLVAVPSGKLVREWKASDGAVWSVVFTPDGKQLISGSGDTKLRIWDVASGESAGVLGGPNEVNWSFAFSPDGKILATGGEEGWVWLWDFKARQVHARRRAHAGGVEQLLFAGGGSRLLSAGDDGALCLWDLSAVRDGRAVKVKAPELARQDALVYAAAVSADGRTLATATSDRRVTLWEAATGRPRATLEGHRGAVASLLFLPGGRRLISGASDGTALVWELGRLASDPGVPLTPERAAALWRDLAGGQSEASYRALWGLAAHPREALALLKSELRPTAPVDAEQVKRWITELGDKRFAVREKATAELRKAGDPAWPALREALKDPPSLEVAGRIRQLLAEDAAVPTAGRLWLLRALELLELLGTPEARRHLEALAGGAPQAWLTREAQAALRRQERPAPR